MGNFGDYYNKSKKKPSKAELAKKATKLRPSWVIPTPLVIKKVKNAS